MTKIADNIAKLQLGIQDALAHTGPQSHQPIAWVAVSKTQSPEKIQLAYEAGIDDFAENYVQEALQKQAELQHLPLVWHFIGPIQSNKTRDIAAHFDWVQSVDRLKVAQGLSDHRTDQQPPLNVCIQVNISEEPTKSGVSVAQLDELVQAVAVLPRLRLRGLMAIPAKNAGDEAFVQLNQAYQRLKTQHPHWNTLSMGMSKDYQRAICAGATMVRIGQGIFGPRSV